MSTFLRFRPLANPLKTDTISAVLTSHERIPIFMIEEKDASTPCDERHVNKQRSNVNLSTQKKTGGKCIMGNQGMTNWKFTAFLAIALILAAGLFTSTVIAADGDGTVAVGWAVDGTLGTDKTEPQSTPSTADGSTLPLPSGSTENELVFRYSLTDDDEINMSGGSFYLRIPSGWKVSKKLITITDDAGTSEVLYDTDKNGKVDNTTSDTDTPPQNEDTGDTRKRVTILPSSGGFVSTVEVSLDGDWEAADNGRELIIQFSMVETPIPSSLPIDDGPETSPDYEAYKFASSSKAKDGTLTPLKPTDDIEEPQPYVQVGEARAGTGTAIITPTTVYQDEKAHSFKIFYTAPGPMYDAQVRVTIPGSLIPADDDADDRTHDEEFEDRITVGEKGGVDFDNTDRLTASAANGQIVVHIDDMHESDEVRVFYEGIDVTDPGADGQSINVETSVNGGSDFVVLPVDNIKGGDVEQRNGSGEVTVNNPAVEINATKSYTFTYKAGTKLTDAYLVVAFPTDSPFVGNADSDGNRSTVDTFQELEKSSSSEYGFVVKADNQTVIASGVGIKWKFSLGASRSISRTISRLRVGDTPGDHDWRLWLVATDPGDALPTGSDADPHFMPKLYVLKAEAKPDAPNVTFAITEPTGDVLFPAAMEKATITFRFTAQDTPIKDGYVSLDIPKDWTAPNEGADAGAAGLVTAMIDADGPGNGDPTAIDKKKISTPSQEIRVTVDDLPQGGTVEITYIGDVQAEADDEVEIASQFKSGKIFSFERVSNTVYVEITNVADGSGEATIDNKTAYDAGSDDNDFTIRFTAKGSMNGGQVRVDLPAGWGGDNALQGVKNDAANYVTITHSSGASLRDTAIGNNRAIAFLDEFGKGDEIRFIYKEIGVQRNLGFATFLVQSAGSRSGDLAPVKGVERPKDADTDAELLGKVYHTGLDDDTGTTDSDESADGMLRVSVVGGGDGSGTAKAVVVSSQSGPASYDFVEDGEVVNRVEEVTHAGDTEAHIRFTYEPIETIVDGELKFTIPSGGWSEPHANSSRDPGFTRVDSNGSVGSEVHGGNSLTVPIYNLETGQSITIDYGAGDGGTEIPTVAKNYAFDIKIKGSETGSPKSVAKAPTVTVRPQASGRGDVDLDTDGDVYAGQLGRTFTITYTAIGQISGGRLKVTVPDGDDWADATSDSVDTSRGTPKYGGGMTADELEDDADLGSVNDLVISGLNMSAGSSLTVAYMSDVQPTAGSVTFGIAFDGGHGPDESFIALDDETVTIMEAAPGSGMATIVQMGTIVVGDTVEDIAITYTAAGQIKGTVTGETTVDRLFKIRVPTADGWSAPSRTAEAAGYYAVTLEKPDEDADDGYSEITDTIEAMAPAKANEADEAATYIVARVLPEKTVEKDQRIIFSYQDAVAPATPGKSEFVVFFDTEEVDTLNVLVQSAEGATQLALSSDADSFILDDGGSTTVTVKLVGPDGTSPATRDEATTVTLSAEGGTIASSVTIPAGSYHADASLSAADPGDITITASATGLEGDELMVTADTDNVSVNMPTVSPMYVAAGSSVTVMATATAAQTVMFSVTNADGVGVQPSTMTEDESGSYTGTFMVVVDQHPDGVYDVTVSINGTSMTAPGALTIDSMAPTVTASASAEMVADGDTVTISAMAADDGSGVASVMADVSMLDSTQGMVELMMGDDGAYSADVMISEDNEADNGAKAVTVTAEDMAGNSSDSDPVMVTLLNEISYTSTIPAGISLFHVPLDVEGLDTVGNLETMLGDNVNLLITYDGTSWNSRSSDMMITADLGILVSLSAEETITFKGNAWGAGDSMINLRAGSNLVGLPVNDPAVAMISDIIGLFDEGVVSSIIVSSGGEFQLVTAAGDAADGPVAGDAAYLVIASADASAMVSGAGWMNGEMAGAAPIALAGYTVDNQTPVLDVHGSVVDEITGLVKEGFRVKVKNLATKAALSNVTSVEAADGYNITFVDLADSYAARVGDVLEITVDSPDPLVGVKPVRHIVTVDDVKNSLIELESLIAYEIPAETELLRNYPNPFNPETWIPYRLAEDADVSLTIYDAYGSLVRSIDIGHQIAAVYDTRAKAIYWDGRNRFGEQVASGLYFYHLSAGDFSGTRRMVILK